jgi:hypothetical protein
VHHRPAAAALLELLAGSAGAWLIAVDFGRLHRLLRAKRRHWVLPEVGDGLEQQGQLAEDLLAPAGADKGTIGPPAIVRFMALFLID